MPLRAGTNFDLSQFSRLPVQRIGHWRRPTIARLCREICFDRESKAPESVTNRIFEASRTLQSHMIADISDVDISTLSTTKYRDLEVIDAYYF